MLNGLRVGLIVPAHNESARLGSLLPRVPADLVDLVVVVDDASTDGTAGAASAHGARVIRHEVRTGPGPAIRDALDLLRREGIDVTAVMAANGKHDPGQLRQLLDPLVSEDLALVRGSRFIGRGSHVNMPWHRLLLVRLFTLLTSLAVGRRVTDATGGFQAYRLCVLDDPGIDLHQGWLGRYEVETYLFVQTVRRGHPWKEVPVRITYPERGPYTRARPLIDWWGYFRPVVLLALRLKH